MDIEGTWIAADNRRAVVFLADGTGFIQVEGERFPFFKWWSEDVLPMWAFFSDEAFAVPMGRASPMNCEEKIEGSVRCLLFQNAPIPFGFRKFTFQSRFTTPKENC